MTKFKIILLILIFPFLFAQEKTQRKRPPRPTTEQTLKKLGLEINDGAIKITEIKTLLPINGIPPLGYVDRPNGTIPSTPKVKFDSLEKAKTWMKAKDPVILVTVNKESKIYPIHMFTYHEIANDIVGGVPIAVTYCPLCNTAIAFDRRIEVNGKKELATFGVSGMLYQSGMVMFDSITHSLWSQPIAQGIWGPQKNKSLVMVLADMMSFEQAANESSNAMVMNHDTGMDYKYGINPYVGYDAPDSKSRFFYGKYDTRLPNKERVAGVISDNKSFAIPFSALRKKTLINSTHISSPFVVFWRPGTASNMDAKLIDDSRDIGSTRVFSSMVNGHQLQFIAKNGQIFDSKTKSIWNHTGLAIDGALKGHQLQPIIHSNHFWFAWASFHPKTDIIK